MDAQPSLDELQRTFVAPRGLDGAGPRDVAFTVGGKALVIVAAILCVVAVTAGILMQRQSVLQAEERRAFAETAVPATAQVVRLWRSTGDSKQPWVAYQFVVNGLGYERRATVSLPQWRALAVGSSLPILYLPSRPDRSILDGTDVRVIPAWLPAVVSTAIAAIPVLFAWLLGRERRLLRDGRVAPAVVTATFKHHSQHGTHQSIAYNFPLLSGAVAAGKSPSRKPPAVGSVICVVYDPERPSRSLPYPFSLVRPAR